MNQRGEKRQSDSKEMFLTGVEESENNLISPNGRDILDVYGGLAQIIHTVKERGSTKVLFENSQEKTDKLEVVYQFFKWVIKHILYPR